MQQTGDLSTALPPFKSSRIASLLPGLTGVVRELSLYPFLVAHSHECEENILSVTHSKLPTSAPLSTSEIAAGWNTANNLQMHCLSPSLESLLSTRLCSFYHVDIPTLARATPTVLLTHVSAPRSPDDPTEAQIVELTKGLIPSLNTIISTNCRTLLDVYQLHRNLARAVRRSELADQPILSARLRFSAIRDRTDDHVMRNQREKKRITVIQWSKPLYLAGDWVPEIIRIAGGGADGFTREGGPSEKVTPRDLRRMDIVVFAICALGIEGCKRVVDEFMGTNANVLRGWHGKIVVTDATRLFSRVDLSTVVQSAEVLAEILTAKTRYRGLLWDEWSKSDMPKLQGQNSISTENQVVLST